VTVLEAFEPGHRRGSSHGSARIFRWAYRDPLYVRLASQARQLWSQLAAETGRDPVVTTGAVDYGPALPGQMYGNLTAAGVPAELLTAAAAAERWPGMSFGAGPVLFHRDGGVLDPELAMSAMHDSATAPAGRRSGTDHRPCGSSRGSGTRWCTRPAGPGAPRR